jgi:nickel-dependent lactate racemase
LSPPKESTGVHDPLIPSAASEARCLRVLEGGACPPPLSDADIAARLRDPIWPGGGGPTVFEQVRPGERACFAVSDQTRASAVDRVLPALVSGLMRRGCAMTDFSVLVATGTHRAPTATEIVSILGAEMAAAFAGRVHAHDPDDAAGLVAVGTTRGGHVVRINRRAAEADRLVLIGAASYHYHAGFGGGRKCLVPGLADRGTIAHTHSLALDANADRMDPRVQVGVLDGNPVAEAIMEAARLRPPTAVVNTVLSPAGEPIGLFCGEMDAAHRAACRLVEAVSRVDLAEPADLVIADAEDAPNWIQAHKALFNAHRALRPGGRMVLRAACPEGLGGERFRYWVKMRDVAALCRELRRCVEVNGQTALSTRVRGADAILVTGLGPRDVEDLGLETAPTMEEATRRALALVRREAPDRLPTCYLMPRARHVVPFLGA